MINKIKQHKNKLYLMQLALLQIFINFITNFLVVKNIGFGNELDIFYISMAVFSFLASSIGWSISSVLTPILIENREKHIEYSLFVGIFLITMSISLIAFMTMPFWSKIIFSNYLENIEYSKILIIQSSFILSFIFNTLSLLFIGIFQEKNQYLKINFLNVSGATIGLFFVYFTIDKYGVYSASFSQLSIQFFLFSVMLAVHFRKIKQNSQFDKDIFLLLWHRMKYIFIGSFYYRTDTLISRYIASFLTPGFLSLIAFIEKIYGAIITVLNTSIAGPTITKFSNLIKEKKYAQIKTILYKYLLLLFAIDLVLFIGMFLFGEKLFLYFFNDRIETALVYVLPITMTISFSIVFGKTLGMLQRSLLMSAKKEKNVTLINSIIFTINIIVKIIATYFYGVYGLLASIFINEVMVLLIQQFYIERRLFNEFNI